MKIDKSVVEVLKASEFDGSLLRLPGLLERKLYEHVAKVLRNIGGKWSSAKKAFDGFQGFVGHSNSLP